MGAFYVCNIQREEVGKLFYVMQLRGRETGREVASKQLH